MQSKDHFRRPPLLFPRFDAVCLAGTDQHEESAIARCPAAVVLRSSPNRGGAVQLVRREGGEVDIHIQAIVGNAKLPQHHHDPFDRILIAEGMADSLTW